METVVRTAKKEHKCAYKQHMILPGETYIEETLPPWQMMAVDVDDDNRTIAEPLGHWEHWRFHGQCRDELMY